MRSGPASLEPADPQLFENWTGLNMQALVDLQRIVACLLVRLGKSQEGLSNESRLFCKSVAACSSHSSRITLLMRQSTAFKLPDLHRS